MFTQSKGGSNKWEYVAPADLLAYLSSWKGTKTDSRHDSKAKDGDSIVNISRFDYVTMVFASAAFRFGIFASRSEVLSLFVAA